MRTSVQMDSLEVRLDRSDWTSAAVVAVLFIYMVGFGGWVVALEMMGLAAGGTLLVAATRISS